MRHWMHKTECAFSVQSDLEGKNIMLWIDNYPLSISLGSVTPNDARVFAKMLMDQADKCDGIAADIERLREIKEAA